MFLVSANQTHIGLVYIVDFVVAIIFVPRPFACLECTYVVVAAFFALCGLACCRYTAYICCEHYAISSAVSYIDS